MRLVQIEHHIDARDSRTFLFILSVLFTARDNSDLIRGLMSYIVL